jgi:hypothetical protein
MYAFFALCRTCTPRALQGMRRKAVVAAPRSGPVTKGDDMVSVWWEEVDYLTVFELNLSRI